MDGAAPFAGDDRRRRVVEVYRATFCAYGDSLVTLAARVQSLESGVDGVFGSLEVAGEVAAPDAAVVTLMVALRGDLLPDRSRACTK